MSGILPTSIGYISPHGDFSRHNTQALSGVSHLWQDFFARALAEQSSEVVPACGTFPPVDLNSPQEPTIGSELHAHIVSQRECNVVETRASARAVVPADRRVRDGVARQAVPTVPAGGTQSPAGTAGFRQQLGPPDRDQQWSANARTRPAPQKKPLYLPIAEFDLDLLQKPYPPFPPEEIVEQQKALDFDNGWARPIVLQNLRLAA